MIARPAIDPIQLDVGTEGRGGMTSATGWPKRVISTGRPVHFTRCMTARHVALNFEIGIVFMNSWLTWSTIMLKSRVPAIGARAQRDR